MLVFLPFQVHILQMSPVAYSPYQRGTGRKTWTSHLGGAVLRKAFHASYRNQTALKRLPTPCELTEIIKDTEKKHTSSFRVFQEIFHQFIDSSSIFIQFLCVFLTLTSLLLWIERMHPPFAVGAHPCGRPPRPLAYNGELCYREDRL